MNMREALEAVRTGKKARRPHWPPHRRVMWSVERLFTGPGLMGTGTVLAREGLVWSTEDEDHFRDWKPLTGYRGGIVDDKVAEDWEVLDEPEPVLAAS